MTVSSIVKESNNERSNNHTQKHYAPTETVQLESVHDLLHVPKVGCCFRSASVLFVFIICAPDVVLFRRGTVVALAAAWVRISFTSIRPERFASQLQCQQAIRSERRQRNRCFSNMISNAQTQFLSHLEGGDGTCQNPPICT